MFEKMKQNRISRNMKREFIRNAENYMQEQAEMPFLSPYIVTLKDWLKGVQGDTSRLNWLTREVLDYEKAHRSGMLNGHVYLIMTKKDGEILVALDDVAVFMMTSEVMKGFFGMEECQREYYELQQLNKLPNMYRNIYESLKEMNPETLKETEGTWLNYSVTEKTEEVRQNILLMIQKVKEQRGFRIDENGTRYIMVSGIRWITNLEHGKIPDKIPLSKSYVPELYPLYRNYDAVNVDRTENIPCDYDGCMGVPITFLDKYNPAQFEIVRFKYGDDGRNFTYIRNEQVIEPYCRIIIRKKAV